VTATTFDWADCNQLCFDDDGREAGHVLLCAGGQMFGHATAAAAATRGQLQTAARA
jgi:hypothetical protein